MCDFQNGSNRQPVMCDGTKLLNEQAIFWCTMFDLIEIVQ
jgi:hypothetical protein